MQVKSIAECSKGSILPNFGLSLSYHLSLGSFVLSIFEWLFYTSFTGGGGGGGGGGSIPIFLFRKQVATCDFPRGGGSGPLWIRP